MGCKSKRVLSCTWAIGSQYTCAAPESRFSKINNALSRHASARNSGWAKCERSQSVTLGQSCRKLTVFPAVVRAAFAQAPVAHRAAWQRNDRGPCESRIASTLCVGPRTTACDGPCFCLSFLHPRDGARLAYMRAGGIAESEKRSARKSNAGDGAVQEGRGGAKRLSPTRSNSRT
jgi:hypothetical protein